MGVKMLAWIRKLFRKEQEQQPMKAKMPTWVKNPFLKYELVEEIPEVCPVCGSERIGQCLYGRAAFENQMEPLQIYTLDGRIKEFENIDCGSVCVPGPRPEWGCLSCQTSFFDIEDAEDVEAAIEALKNLDEDEIEACFVD